MTAGYAEMRGAMQAQLMSYLLKIYFKGLCEGEPGLTMQL